MTNKVKYYDHFEIPYKLQRPLLKLIIIQIEQSLTSIYGSSSPNLPNSTKFCNLIDPIQTLGFVYLRTLSGYRERERGRERMRDAGLDLFDPRATVMDSDCNLSPSNGREQEDFAFAFNDSNFSDRVLRIEIMPDSPDTRPDLEGCLTLADWATRKSKRRRGDIGDGEKENGKSTLWSNMYRYKPEYCY